MKKTSVIVLGIIALATLGLAGFSRPAAGPGREEDRAEVVSLLGRKLYARPVAADIPRLEGALREAALKLEAGPDDPGNIINYGRALAGLWRYHEAIDVYTRGIAGHPDEAMLYRHRGHRFITVRDFDRAVADLARAAELDARDYDIWYHLGLAHYLKGEFALAEPAYRKCRDAARDDGSVVAVSNWLYIALRRQGKSGEAAKVLETIREGMDPGENTAYYNLLLFYKGLKKETELETAAASSDLDLATTGYGLACWHLYNGEPETAVAFFKRIVDIPYWPAFGFIAAEAELHRIAPAAREENR